MNRSDDSTGKVQPSPKTPKGRKLVQGRLPFAVVDNKTKPLQAKVTEDEPEKEKLEVTLCSDTEDKEDQLEDHDEDGSNSAHNEDLSILSTSLNLNSSIEKETPKKTEQAKRKKEEKLKERELREKKKAEEKALKEQQKREKEEEKKKREELKELEKKRKEEEKKKKEEEKEADKKRKEEEKKRKEEEKEAEKKRKEEEKRRKEEEKENEKKKKEEEERRKKERLSQVFTNFFTQKKTTPAKTEVKEEIQSLAFPPFQVKDHMKLAPIVRTDFDFARRETLENVLKNSESCSISTQIFKSGRKSGPTWPMNREIEMENDIEIIGEEEESVSNKQDVIHVIPANGKRARAKLLQFCENRRPAYWGTWAKKSGIVKPRRPFGRDMVFDYEVDSDDEWEEVEPGESLTDCEDEDKEPVDDYEVDNDFLVPHGYLSEEEGENDEDEKPLSPSAAKEQLKIKEEQFERELKEKTHHIKPSLIGCCWSESLEEEPHVYKVLKKYAAVIVSEHNIISLALNDLGCADSSPNLEDIRSENKVARRPINDEDIPVLLKILHGSTYSKVTIVKEFLAHIQQPKNDDAKRAPSKAKTLAKIAEIATWSKCSEPGPMNGRVCWLVNPEILQKYNLRDLSVVNTWEFSTDIKKRGRTRTDDSKIEEETPPAKTPRMSLVRKFPDATVPVDPPTQEEPKSASKSENQTTEVNASSSTTPAPKAKKRIALISLPSSASKKIKSEGKSTPLTNFLRKITAKDSSADDANDADDMDGVECLE